MSYESDLAEIGYTPEQVEQINDSTEWYRFTRVGKSKVHGKGYFTFARRGELIGKAVFGSTRTEIGRYINHSPEPNVKFVRNDPYDVDIIAIKDISGEVFVDYRQVFREITSKA